MRISKYIIVLLLILQMLQSTAQINIGVSSSYSVFSSGKQEAPISLSKQQLSDQIQYLGQSNAVSFGLAAYTSFDKLFFRADAQYTAIERHFIISTIIGTEGDIFRNENTFGEKNHFISIPISAGLQVKQFQIGLGPVFNFRIDSDDTLVKNTNLSHSSRGLSTGFQYFLGYRINNSVHINTSLEQSLSNVGNDFTYNSKGTQLNIRPVTVRIGAAYFFND
jgi:hypothetical protein